MGRNNSVVVTLLALLFGVVAIALSFGAYAKRIKAEDVLETYDSCIYPHSASFALGIVAALCLLIQQIIISVGIGCYCCCGNKCPTACCGIISIILFVFSWISFIIAFMGLIFTAILNNNSFLSNAYPGANSGGCKLGQDNLFLGGAIWCIINVVLGLISHVTYKLGNRHSGCQMEQPQMYDP